MYEKVHHCRWNDCFKWILQHEEQMDGLSAFLLGKICDFYQACGNIFIIQWFSMRDEWSDYLFVSFFVAKKRYATDITNLFWRAIIVARAPPIPF